MAATARCCAWCLCLLARLMRTLAIAPVCGPSSCAEMADCWDIRSTTQEVMAPHPLTLHCDVGTKGGGWTIIQQRRDSHYNFYRRWNDYKLGFGSGKTFWIGLENMHRLTRNVETTMRIAVTHGRYHTTQHAMYDGVTIANEEKFYALNYDYYNRRSQLKDGLRLHKGAFCCQDSPAGSWCRERAMRSHTGWWLGQSKRMTSDLNAKLSEGGNWGAYWVSIPTIHYTQIMIRPSMFGTTKSPCDRSCPNGGTCLHATNGTFHCRCASGYKGQRCETSTAVHVARPRCNCMNGGTCLPIGRCLCPFPFTSSRCLAILSAAGVVNYRNQTDTNTRSKTWRNVTVLLVVFGCIAVITLVVALAFFAGRRLTASDEQRPLLNN